MALAQHPLFARIEQRRDPGRDEVRHFLLPTASLGARALAATELMPPPQERIDMPLDRRSDRRIEPALRPYAIDDGESETACREG